MLFEGLFTPGIPIDRIDARAEEGNGLVSLIKAFVCLIFVHPVHMRTTWSCVPQLIISNQYFVFLAQVVLG